MGVSTAEAHVLPADKQAALFPVVPVQLAYAGTQVSVSKKVIVSNYLVTVP